MSVGLQDQRIDARHILAIGAEMEPYLRHHEVIMFREVYERDIPRGALRELRVSRLVGPLDAESVYTNDVAHQLRDGRRRLRWGHQVHAAHRQDGLLQNLQVIQNELTENSLIEKCPI